MPVSALRLRIQCYNYLTQLFKAQNSVHDKAFLPLFLTRVFSIYKECLKVSAHYFCQFIAHLRNNLCIICYPKNC